MIKKFSVFIIFGLLSLVGAMVGLHWKTIEGFQGRVTEVTPLFQRQKILAHLRIDLEKYRQESSGFRKLSPEAVVQAKEKLRASFAQGANELLNRWNPNQDQRSLVNHLGDALNTLLTLSAQFEPLLYNKDAYIKSEVVDLHDKLVSTLKELEKLNESSILALRLDSLEFKSQSLFFLSLVGFLMVCLVLSLLFQTHRVYFKPLQKLCEYAVQLKEGRGRSSESVSSFIGLYGEIEKVLQGLAMNVETYVRDRHKFILDVVSDLKGPLSLLQAGKSLIEGNSSAFTEEQQNQAAESVRRGLSIFSGSLDDLNDIVNINLLESRLQSQTLDLSELLSDVARTLLGSDFKKRVQISVPPIPVWVLVDAHRFERVLIHILSKVFETLSEESSLSISVSVSQAAQRGVSRGIEILIQDTERLRAGKVTLGGPEQDLLKHWISEKGLNMSLVHKIMKAHQGSVTAAGVSGTSVTVAIRLPQERVVTRGLISPPTTIESPKGLETRVLNSRAKERLGNE